MHAAYVHRGSVQFRAIDEPPGWWAFIDELYAYPPFAKNRGIKKEKEKGRRRRKKKKRRYFSYDRAPLSSHLPCPPPPRSYARHYSRRFHADPRCPHGSSTVKHTVDIGETVLAINPEYRQKPGLYGGPSTSMELSATMEENGKRRFVSRVNRRFFLFSLFFFLQRRHAILCRDSFSTDRSRNFEKWEFCWT